MGESIGLEDGAGDGESDGEGEVACGGTGGVEVGGSIGPLEGDGVEVWGDVYGEGEMSGDEDGVGEVGDKAGDDDDALGGYAIGPLAIGEFDGPEDGECWVDGAGVGVDTGGGFETGP